MLMPVSHRSRQPDAQARTRSLATPRRTSASLSFGTTCSEPFSAHDPLGCPSGLRLVHTKRYRSRWGMRPGLARARLRSRLDLDDAPLPMNVQRLLLLAIPLFPAAI